MYVTVPSPDSQADVRPLPVEKSAGKVSSLVARWQTAANKEQESAARQRDSESRRSSSVSQSSRRSSENHSVKPSPRVDGGSSAQAGEKGDVIEELKDLDIEDTQKVRGDDVDKDRGTKGEFGKGGEAEKAKEMKETTPDIPPEPKQAEQVEKPTIPNSPVIKKRVSGVAIGSPKASKMITPRTTKASVPPSPKASTAKATTPSKIPTASAAKQPSSTSSIRTRTTSGSSRIPQAVKSQTSSTADPIATKSQDKTDSVATSAKTPSAPTKTPAKTPAPTKASAAGATSVPRPSTADKTPLASATKAPRPAPSSFSRTTASKLTPSHTGSVNRPSSAIPDPSAISPTPLRPQITGTPSKPTASSLAKAKEASEKRKSLSLGKSSSIQVQQSSVKETPKSTSTGTVRPTVPSSASRLMQGTASSRAKAAAVQPASPTRTKTVKSNTSTPSKASTTKEGITPAKSVNGSAGPNVVSKDDSDLPKNAAPSRILEPKTAAPLATQSVIPRTPSPRPRSVPDEEPDTQGEQAEEEQTEQEEALDPEKAKEGNGEGNTSQEISRAAIIGRVGLAGAREAPSTSETGQSASRDLETAKTSDDKVDDNDNDDKPESSITAETVDESLLAQLHPGDIDPSGHIADPEMPRSAPSPDQKEASTKNLFGRIGHPGATAGVHELESPNPKPEALAEKMKDTPKKETEWHEEELRRDPTKTIVSPDAVKSKGEGEGEKE